MDTLISVLGKIFSYDSGNPISFISGYFLFAFTLLLFIFSFVSQKVRYRKWLLIFFNFFFYFKLTGLLFLVILIPTVTDFFLAKTIHKTDSDFKKKIFLYCSVFISLGLLIYFKYTNFFLEILNSVSGNSISLLKIAVPIGISFYVFRTISYILDVYNEKIDPVEKFSDYLLYMTFFPLLISGPITRAEQFVPQINEENSVSREKVNDGLFLIFKGIIKKAVFADYLGLYVLMIFSTPEGYTGLENLVGIVCFTVQLYLDFSGYTDIAMGISKLLGFEIGINFNEPLKAKSVSDFWRRWHISLSEWLRDYLFFPMNFYFRKLQTFGAIIAMFITFFICGIWHGAAWIFVLFGVLHGIVLSWEIFLRNRIPDKKALINRFRAKTGWLFTFVFICITMIAMRADNLTSAAGIVKRVFTDMDLSYATLYFTVQYVFTAMFSLAVILIFLPSKFKEQIRSSFYKAPIAVKVAVFLITVQVIVEMENQHIIPFIYAKY